MLSAVFNELLTAICDVFDLQMPDGDDVPSNISDTEELILPEHEETFMRTGTDETVFYASHRNAVATASANILKNDVRRARKTSLL